MAVTVTLIGSESATPADPLSISISGHSTGDTIVIGVVTDDSTDRTYTATAQPGGASFTLVKKQVTAGGDAQQHYMGILNSIAASQTSIDIDASGTQAMIGYALAVSGLDATTKQDRAADVVNSNTGSTTSPFVLAGNALAPVTNDCAVISAFAGDVNASNDVTTTFSGTNTTAWTKKADLNNGFLNIAVGWAQWTNSGNVTPSSSNAFTTGGGKRCDGSIISVYLRPATGGASVFVPLVGHAAAAGMPLAGVGGGLAA